MEEKVHCRMLRRTLKLAMKHNEKLDEPQNRKNVLKKQQIGMRVEPTMQWEFWAEVHDNHLSSSDEEEEILCSGRGRGRKTDILPRLPRETSACKTDFGSNSYGKGRARIIRDNLILTKEKPLIGLPKDTQISVDKPDPVFIKPEKVYNEFWNDEDFPALGSAADKGNESAVRSRGNKVYISNQSILDTHKVNNEVTIFSDSVSCKPDSDKDIKVASRTLQVPARIKDSLKSLCESTKAWYEDVCATSPYNSAFQLPKESDMLHKETTHLSGDKTSYDEDLMNRYLNNSLASSKGSHVNSRSVAGSIPLVVRNELSHLQRDDKIRSNVTQSFGDVLYTHLDLAKDDNDLEDNNTANKNYQHITMDIKNQSSSDGEKSDIMHQHIDPCLVTNDKQSDINVNASNLKGEKNYKSTTDKGSLDRKQYKNKIRLESNSSDCHKWKVKGKSVIQVDGLPPSPDLSGLVDLIASFGTISDQEVSNHSTGSSARFKLASGDSCDLAVECLHDSGCLYADSNRVLMCYRIPL
ncbi:hypothetical protein ACJMK2_035479 [Sinanodonta woodiana]|uniref:Uncharacterized protein n=1 Tax=Sinanodonta woodiana TaxID=1069815 RepID=A0ABD3WV31_SINWO